MNLTRVLNVALPEIPAHIVAENPPRVPPGAVHKEHIEDGEPIVLVVVPNKSLLYRFPPANWELIELFNGQRSFEEIAKVYSNQLGAEYSADDVREFAASVEELGFWYKTPQEKNIQLMRLSADERRKVLKAKKSRYGDLAEITFPAVNPDKFITWLYSYTSWIYTWWFTLLTLAFFAVAAAISVAHWSEIGRDTVEFYNFTDKSWGDFAIFYFLAVAVLCIHELAHGHATKHYGANVPAMGFLLIYLTPAFYTDTTEGYVRASKYQRIVIVVAGVWSELMICAVATPIWWVTVPNTALHNAAYIVMLMTGIAGILLNWNPLMKLDGYQILIELIEVAELKEDSTAYVSAWVKRHIWRLPVEVPYVPKKRRLGFAVYALLSGAYSYTVLYILAHFVGNVFRNFNPEWSFIPEIATAALIFRSRIRNLVNFMILVYLDKKDRIWAWFTLRNSLAVSAALVLFLFLPLWHETVVGRFALEPVQRAVIHAIVPGTVTDVFATEGMSVGSSTLLMRLRNLPLQSKIDESRAAYEGASTRAKTASFQYANLGTALRERENADKQRREWALQGTYLDISSPLAGVVVTPRLGDRLGAFLQEGAEVAEVADLGLMRARVYVSEHDISKIRTGFPAKLEIDGFATKYESQAGPIAPVSTESDPRLAGHKQYSGLNPPKFYVVDLTISNSKNLLRPGMVGTARVYGKRKSLGGLLWEGLREFMGRKLW
ncbi:MAG: HlyD family efflux transporter periplasmic adaptor subunit [Candidatus Acidiferrum sp.]